MVGTRWILIPLVLGIAACSLAFPFEDRSPDNQSDAALPDATPASCGNWAIELGEDCDGENLGGHSCTTLGYEDGVLRCRTDCSFDTFGCSGEDPCGNGAIDPGEACDGVELGGASCEDVGATGVLACLPDCQLDLSNCTAELPGRYDEFEINTVTDGDQVEPRVDGNAVAWVDHSGIPPNSGTSNVRYRLLDPHWDGMPQSNRFLDPFESVAHTNVSGNESAPAIATPRYDYADQDVVFFFVDERPISADADGLGIFFNGIGSQNNLIGTQPDVPFTVERLDTPMWLGDQDQVAVGTYGNWWDRWYVVWRSHDTDKEIYFRVVGPLAAFLTQTDRDQSRLVHTSSLGDRFDPVISAAHRFSSLETQSVMIAWTEVAPASAAAIYFRVAEFDGDVFQGYVDVAQALSTRPGGDQSEPDVVGICDIQVCPDVQRFVAVWRDASGQAPDSDLGGIRGRFLGRFGQPLGLELQVNTTMAGDQRRPRVTTFFRDGACRVLVVWEDVSGELPDSEGTAIRARAFDADGMPLSIRGSTDDFVVNQTYTGDQRSPWVSRTGGLGYPTPIVVWEDWSATGTDSQGSSIRGRYLCTAANSLDCMMP